MTDIDLTNCELSIEELDTVAAGGFWGDLLHAVEHTVSTVYNDIRHPIATFERFQQTREAMQEELLRVWERDRKTVVFVTHSIAEAVFLADRVVVLSPRPGVVQAEVPVAARRLRSRTSDQFVAAYRAVEQALRREESLR